MSSAGATEPYSTHKYYSALGVAGIRMYAVVPQEYICLPPHQTLAPQPLPPQPLAAAPQPLQPIPAPHQLPPQPQTFFYTVKVVSTGQSFLLTFISVEACHVIQVINR